MVVLLFILIGQVLCHVPTGK